MFILCTYIDGQRWTSSLEPLLYPTGVSFYRPFSYRREYFQPTQLADQLSDPSQCRSLLSSTWNEGFFGVRFRDPAHASFLPLFVPLRKVTILRVEASDQVNIHFKLGAYVCPTPAASGETGGLLPNLGLGGLVPDAAETKLLIFLREADKSIASGWRLCDNFPPGMWEALEKTISPTARNAILNALLLRLVELRQRGKAKALVPEEIDSARQVWGFRLQENRAYDASLAYFRVTQPGAEWPTVEHQYCLTNPPEEMQASRRTIQINANYRDELIWISPKIAVAGPVQVALEPCLLGDTKVVDQSASKTIGLKFPVLVEPQRWSKKRKVDLLIGLLSFGAAAWSWRRYQLASEPAQKVLLVLIAALASLCLTSIKDFLMPRR